MEQATETNLAIPKASVKRIMKISEDVANISAEAVIAVSKLTELFLEKLIAESCESCSPKSKKTLRFEDINTVVNENKYKYEFLQDSLQPKEAPGGTRTDG